MSQPRGKQTELQLRQILGAVDVRQEPRINLDNARLELLERGSESELACAKPPFEDGQRAATVRAGQRPSLRHSGIAAACRSEHLQRLGRDERQVNRKRDDHVETGGTQTGDDSRQRSPNTAVVVPNWKAQRKPVKELPAGQPLVAPRKALPRDVRERLLADPGKSFRRSKPPAPTADQQNAGHALAVVRRGHTSVLTDSRAGKPLDCEKWGPLEQAAAFGCLLD
jgi:hypothetical protein